MYNQSLEISREREDQQTKARTLNNIGLIHDRKGEYHEAIKMYNQSLRFKEREDQQTIARTLNNIGSIHYEKEEYDEAIKMCTIRVRDI